MSTAGLEIIVAVVRPNYYSLFGFVPANSKGIECEFEVCDAAWMITELKQDALTGGKGKGRFKLAFKDTI